MVIILIQAVVCHGLSISAVQYGYILIKSHSTVLNLIQCMEKNNFNFENARFFGKGHQ